MLDSPYFTDLTKSMLANCAAFESIRRYCVAVEAIMRQWIAHALLLTI
jgi:hypothetical protein